MLVCVAVRGRDSLKRWDVARELEHKAREGMMYDDVCDGMCWNVLFGLVYRVDVRLVL